MQDENIDTSRRAFLTGHWQSKPEISTACLNSQGIYCQSCREVCDEEAIVFKQSRRGLQSPSIVSDKCTQCEECVTCCPVEAITINQPASFKQ